MNFHQGQQPCPQERNFKGQLVTQWSLQKLVCKAQAPLLSFASIHRMSNSGITIEETHLQAGE